MASNSSFTNVAIGNMFDDFTWDDLTPTYQNINNALYIVGFSSWQREAKNVNSVMIFFALVGSMSYGEIQCDIYNDDGTGLPDVAGGSLGSTTATATGSYVTGVFNNFTFASAVALSANTNYHYIFKNLNATPASNYFRFGRYIAYQLSGDGLGRFDSGFKYSANAGTSWTTAPQTAMWRLGYSDGSYEGMPALYGVGQTIGVLPIPPTVGYIPAITTPSFRMRLQKLQIAFDKIGTITGGRVGCYIFDSTQTLIATSVNTLDLVNISTTGYEYGFTFDDIVLSRDSLYYIVPYYDSKVGTGYIAVMCGQANATATDTALCRQVLGLNAVTYSYNGTTFSNVPLTSGSYPYYIIPIRLWGNIDEPIVPNTTAIASA